MLEIKNLFVSVDKRDILKDFSLSINDGEIHVLMGPNGTGKSTLCKAIMKDSSYKIDSGSILFHDKDLTKLSTCEVAREKVFLLNQNPIAVEGVSSASMLRMALSEVTGKQVGIFEFSKKIDQICKKLNLDSSFVHRDINVGMSGGERKKNELIHMWMLEPSLILLDEIDSGLDVDAIKLVASSINEYYDLFHPTILIITHHCQLLDYIKPNYVHIMKDGKIVESGDLTLAKKIEKEGFLVDNGTFAISDDDKHE